MKGFRWHRRRIFLDEYNGKMGVKKKDSSNVDGEQESKLCAAYRVASEIRQFEIELFWKRATFFWAFIVAIYTAYYQVLTKIYDLGDGFCPRYQHGVIPLLVLSAVGLFFCFSWLLSSYGSKHWLENWENHLDLLEDYVTGPLYKTYEAGKAYSESKITIAAGWAVTMCAYGLLLYEFANLLLCRVKFEKGIVAVLVTIAFAIITVVCLFLYSKIVIGNVSDSGEISFQTKIYEEI